MSNQKKSVETKKSSVKRSTQAVKRKPSTSGKTIPKPKLPIGLKLNWDRAIYINKRIDDTLLKDLTPIILSMKQAGNVPITVGIDSPGGNLSTLQSLLGLLKSPDQDGNKVKIYTAATNNAYSAAASFLAFGDYAVAFPHSNILYHDVRYIGMDDITPSKALKTARDLQRGNDAFSLRLANHIAKRLIWVYINLMDSFEETHKQYSNFASKFTGILSEIIPERSKMTVDIVGFALTLYKRLSRPIDDNIAIKALIRLDQWIQIERLERKLSETKNEAGDTIDVLEGIKILFSKIREMESEEQESQTSPDSDSDSIIDKSAEKEVKLLLEVIARRFSKDKDLRISENDLDLIVEDFMFIKDMNNPRHLQVITELMIDYDFVLFNRNISDELNSAKTDEERNKVLSPIYPQARLLWYYFVLICRCLFEGDHLLTPSDAQLLGIVDEVLGGGPIESRREWRKGNPNYQQAKLKT